MAASSLLRVEAATHITPRLCGVGDDVRGIVLRLHNNHTAFLKRLHAAVTEELDRQVASTGPLSEQVWLKARTPRRRTIALPCLSCPPPKVERYHETVPFDAGSASISGRTTSLTEWAKRIAPRNQLVEVRGHADPTEPDPKALSLARANGVRAILLKAGLDPSRVTAVGFGADMPVATNKTPEGRTQNRELWLESLLSLPVR
jgi:outer membrane protein OmpA-like peptidoglycan-associated protein